MLLSRQSPAWEQAGLPTQSGEGAPSHFMSHCRAMPPFYMLRKTEAASEGTGVLEHLDPFWAPRSFEWTWMGQTTWRSALGVYICSSMAGELDLEGSWGEGLGNRITTFSYILPSKIQAQSWMRAPSYSSQTFLSLFRLSICFLCRYLQSQKKSPAT